MRHLILFSVVLVVLPAIFQIWYGRKAVYGTTRMHFGLVCFVSLIAQVVFTFFGFRLTLYSLSARGFQCGMPAVGFLTIGVALSLIIFLTIGIQLYLKITHK